MNLHGIRRMSNGPNCGNYPDSFAVGLSKVKTGVDPAVGYGGSCGHYGTQTLPHSPKNKLPQPARIFFSCRSYCDCTRWSHMWVTNSSSESGGESPGDNHILSKSWHAT